MAVLLRQAHDALTEVRLRAELSRLRGELLHEILCENLRKPGDVEDPLLRIERRQLSAKLRQCIHDARCHLAHPRVELREQTRGSAANDRDVGGLVRCHAVEE
jgi:hypothetical protein